MEPPRDRKRRTSMRLHSVAVTVALLAVAACDSSGRAADDVDGARPIQYPTGSDDVLIQVGDYHFSWPDEFLTGPEVVVYGDGSAFAELRDPSPADASARRAVSGELGTATIQSLLRSAAAVPTDASVGLLAEDGVPTLLVVGDQRWEITDDADEVLIDLLSLVRNAIDDIPSSDWAPEQWTVRSPGTDCAMSDHPISPSFHSAPIYPHVVGTDPFADVDCAG